jgi:hypothetical protein
MLEDREREVQVDNVNTDEYELSTREITIDVANKSF